MKLDNKGEKSIFLGISDKSKAYKLYNPSTMKNVISHGNKMVLKKIFQ